MLLLGYVLCDVCINETWNTPGTEGNSAHLYYLDKIAGGRSTLVLVFKSRTKENFNGSFLKDVNAIFSWKWSCMLVEQPKLGIILEERVVEPSIPEQKGQGSF